jgi:hypothetical protein
VPRQCSLLAPRRTRARPIWRRPNDEPKERRSTASPWHAKHSSRRRRASSSGTHTQRLPATVVCIARARSLANECATCSTRRPLSCDEPPACRASQRSRALGLSAEIGSARVAGAWWARWSAAEHRGR